MNNKKLILVVVVMIPLVVISFFLKHEETNFILDENTENNLDNKEYIEPSIRLLKDNEIIELSLENYIIGVVAGEMPASFNKEALKAQAVASRSYAIYKKNSSNGLYDLTSDASSQVYLSNDEMQNKWDKQFNEYFNKIKSAVYETQGEVITYDDEVIEALYFSMSSGKTQNSKDVFSEERPYLKAVSSEYDNDSLNNYEVIKKLSKDEFIKALDLTCDDPKVDVLKQNQSGYIETVTICSKKMTGQQFRMALGLRSANVKIDIEESVTLTTKGYGHGVGMSQYGANGYAEAGYNYDDIIKHYYTDVEIKNLKSV